MNDPFGPDGRPDPRREPTLGEPHAAAEVTQPDRKTVRAAGAAALRGYEFTLADSELLIDNVELLDGNGFNQLVLTDRRVIICGRARQTIYPLRTITRIAVVKYVRWWLAMLGATASALGMLGGLLPVFVFKSSDPMLAYLWAGLFAAGIALAVFALLRPVIYVEIKSTSGDLKLRLTGDYEALMGFLNSLGQRIGRP